VSLRELDPSVLEKMLLEKVNILPTIGDVTVYLDTLIEITAINTALFKRVEEDLDDG